MLRVRTTDCLCSCFLPDALNQRFSGTTSGICTDSDKAHGGMTMSRQNDLIPCLGTANEVGQLRFCIGQRHKHTASPKLDFNIDMNMVYNQVHYLSSYDGAGICQAASPATISVARAVGTNNRVW